MSDEKGIKRPLADLSRAEIAAWTEAHGYPKYRAEQIHAFVTADKDLESATNIPRELLTRLSDEFVFRAAEIAESFQGRDGTVKYLFRFADGNRIEGVFMRHNYGNTLCVSTQIGCRMGCAFCASGLDGLVRDLTAGEILSEVLAANRANGGTQTARAVTNLVLMGAGEPLDNFANTVKFLELVSEPDGINISPRNISLSTSGIVPKILELADLGMPLNLTVSLHAADDETRSKIMPVNKKYSVAEVIKAARYYFDKTKRRLIFEYAMIAGINDSVAAAERLARLVRGMPCHINIINLNFVKEKGLKTSSRDAVAAFRRVLDGAGVSNTVRRSMGADIEGACGQLRRKRSHGGE